jgi:uncharacterized membrane protein
LQAVRSAVAGPTGPPEHRPRFSLYVRPAGFAEVHDRNPGRDARYSGCIITSHLARRPSGPVPYNPHQMNGLAWPHRDQTARRQSQAADAVGRALRRHWFPIAFALVGLYAGLPWLAPAFMRLGWTAPGQAIYGLYSTQCHQMAQRSYFVFGPRLMYTPAELKTAGAALDPLGLRAFVGTPELGWKVAWSDRMASMYAGLVASMLGLRLLRRRVPPLPLWGLVLLLLPLAIDGTTHLFSDLSGFGRGFRDTNLWLAALTAGRFTSGFYAGDAWGSFNAAMRLLTGGLFGLAFAWFALPRVQAALEGDVTRTPATRPRPGAAI